MNLNEYTLGKKNEAVNVAEFRNRIQHLERTIHIDRHACVGSDEKALNVDNARRVGVLLIATTCKRATHDDWERRERIIDLSTAYIDNQT